MYSYCSLYIMSSVLMEDCQEHFVFFLYLTPYSRVFLKKGNNCTYHYATSCFYGTQWLISTVTKVHHCIWSWASSILHILLFYHYCSPCTHWFAKWSLSLMFSNQHFVCIITFSHLLLVLVIDVITITIVCIVIHHPFMLSVFPDTLFNTL